MPDKLMRDNTTCSEFNGGGFEFIGYFFNIGNKAKVIYYGHIFPKIFNFIV